MIGIYLEKPQSQSILSVKRIPFTIETMITITTHNLWLKAKAFNLKLIWKKIISRNLSSIWVHTSFFKLDNFPDHGTPRGPKLQMKTSV